MTKSGTETWGLGCGGWDVETGLGDVRLGDVARGMRGLGDVGLGTWDSGTWDMGRGRRGRAGIRGRDKQTTPDICAEFVDYNFRWSRESYDMLESF